MKGFDRYDVTTSWDERGWVSNLLDFLPISPDTMKNIHLTSMEPGAVRGNHYHERTNEALVVLGEKVRVVARDNTTGEVFQETVGKQTPVMYVVRPGISHAFRNLGENVAHLVCFTDATYEVEKPDLVVDPIIRLGE